MPMENGVSWLWSWRRFNGESCSLLVVLSCSRIKRDCKTFRPQDCRTLNFLNRDIKLLKMKSKLFTLDWRDLMNGLLIAFLAAMIDGIIKILGSGAVFDWPHLQPVVIAGISAALSYLLKSLATNSRNQLFTKEPG